MLNECWKWQWAYVIAVAPCAQHGAQHVLCFQCVIRDPCDRFAACHYAVGMLALNDWFDSLACSQHQQFVPWTCYTHTTEIRQLWQETRSAHIHATILSEHLVIIAVAYIRSHWMNVICLARTGHCWLRQSVWLDCNICGETSVRRYWMTTWNTVWNQKQTIQYKNLPCIEHLWLWKMLYQGATGISFIHPVKFINDIYCET